jgi:acyl-CoA thioesterase-1
VVLSCGVNDAVIEEGEPRVPPEISVDNVCAILAAAAARRNTIMVGPPPIDDDALNERVERLAARYADVARTLDVPFIDLFTPLFADEAYRTEVAANDGAHPRSAGYVRMAEIVRASEDWWF